MYTGQEHCTIHSRGIQATHQSPSRCPNLEVCNNILSHAHTLYVLYCMHCIGSQTIQASTTEPVPYNSTEYDAYLIQPNGIFM